DNRHAGTACRTLRTLFFRSRYTRSMGNFMKNVCTDSQGFIHSPVPGSRDVCLSSPTRRLALVSATSTFPPRRVLRVWFRTDTFNFEDYNTVTRVIVADGLPVRNFSCQIG